MVQKMSFFPPSASHSLIEELNIPLNKQESYVDPVKWL